MRRILAILCTLFILCSSLNLAVFATTAETENVQTNAVVLEQDTADLVIDGGATLDLNGYSVNNMSVRGGGGTLLCTARTVRPTTTQSPTVFTAKSPAL